MWAVVRIWGEGRCGMGRGGWKVVSLERWIGLGARSMWPGGSLDLTLAAVDGGFQVRGWPSHHVALD